MHMLHHNWVWIACLQTYLLNVIWFCPRNYVQYTHGNMAWTGVWGTVHVKFGCIAQTPNITTTKHPVNANWWKTTTQSNSMAFTNPCMQYIGSNSQNTVCFINMGQVKTHLWERDHASAKHPTREHVAWFTYHQDPTLWQKIMHQGNQLAMCMGMALPAHAWNDIQNSTKMALHVVAPNALCLLDFCEGSSWSLFSSPRHSPSVVTCPTFLWNVWHKAQNSGKQAHWAPRL
jgi:hypothetical protein